MIGCRCNVLTILLFALAVSSGAAVRLPRVFSDNMVLQRDKPVPVWGWAEPGDDVTVAFAGQTRTVRADAAGRWRTAFDAMPASDEPRELTASCTANPAGSARARNVLVGDVWVCSGDFGVYYNTYACTDAEEELPRAVYPAIRLLRVADRTSNTPLDDIQGAWMPCSPESVSGFSGLGYFFARALQRELNVPIGMIDCSYRYSYMRSFLPPEGIRGVPDLKAARERMESWDSTTATGQKAFGDAIAKVEEWLPAAEQALGDGAPIAPQPRMPAPIPARDTDYGSIRELSVAYYGMLHPLIPFAIRGVIWSQGENGAENGLVAAYFRGICEGWREAWGQGIFPVYFELLPAVGPVGAAPGALGYWGQLRAEQLEGLAVTNTGLVVTFDVSDYVADARNRQDPGERFARLALAREYGKDVVDSGPRYLEHRVEGNRVLVTFDAAGDGLMAGEKAGLAAVRERADGVLEHFAIAGADRQWHWADARIEGNTVVLHCAEVPAPEAVRYAWSDNPQGANLYNRDGWPAVPFRTDSW